MSLKTRILDRLNRFRGLFDRPDLPEAAVTPVHRTEPGDRVQRPGSPAAPGRLEHLGPYGPLVVAIREELERFIAGDVRLHLSIASHDRYLLTAIEITCTDSGQTLALLRRFCDEFKPEQIKRFLAREVIGGLPNASAIDLSQFSGLTVTDPAGAPAEADDQYAELLAALGGSSGSIEAPPLEVTLRGRWYEADTRAADAAADSPHGTRTPLAGRAVQVEIEDAAGARRITLPSVVPGRRYSIGKDRGCDIAVDGTYASRRHGEVWLDGGRWWISDAGSTNGIRVESGDRVLARSGAPASTASAVPSAIELAPGARIVLSARTEGPPSDYPRLTVLAAELAPSPATPLAMPAGTLATPLTPIARPQRADNALSLTARTAAGTRAVRLDPGRLPFSIGRSRSQALTVPPEHEGVSGHHIDLLTLDASGADVAVHGDNGVTVGATNYPAGARFRWRLGEPMVLGRALPHEPTCTLTLSSGP